jgi:hypothetical protein
VLLPVIGAMPGVPREEAFTVLRDWRGTFQPGPGFASYEDPVAGPAGITDGIMRQVRDAVPVLRRVADEQSGKHRRDVLALLHALEAGWGYQDPLQKRSRRKLRTNDPAWPGSDPGTLCHPDQVSSQD